jgi:hypothetical protein
MSLSDIDPSLKSIYKKIETIEEANIIDKINISLSTTGRVVIIEYLDKHWVWSEVGNFNFDVWRIRKSEAAEIISMNYIKKSGNKRKAEYDVYFSYD